MNDIGTCRFVKPGDRVVRVIKSNLPIAVVGDAGVIIAEDDATRKQYGAMSDHDLNISPMVLCAFDNGKTGPCFTNRFMFEDDLMDATKGGGHG